MKEREKGDKLIEKYINKTRKKINEQKKKYKSKETKENWIQRKKKKKVNEEEKCVAKNITNLVNKNGAYRQTAWRTEANLD